MNFFTGFLVGFLVCAFLGANAIEDSMKDAEEKGETYLGYFLEKAQKDVKDE